MFPSRVLRFFHVLILAVLFWLPGTFNVTIEFVDHFALRFGGLKTICIQSYGVLWTAAFAQVRFIQVFS